MSSFLRYPVTLPRFFFSHQYHLQSSFPHIPKPYIRRQLQPHSSLYAPTHFSILETEKSLAEKRPYAPKFTRAKLSKPRGDDPPFEEEKAWLDAEFKAGGGNEKEVDADGEEVKEEEDVAIDNVDDAEDGIECQCCFADYPFVRIPMLNLLIRLL
jgi:E3 ubiquitin-protein ligase RNF216